MTRYEKIKEVLDGLSTSELVYVHNQYCDETNNMDDYIYSMDEFDEIMNGYSPWEAVRAAFYGEFCPAHDYFWFNGYANLESADFPEDKQIFTCDIARYIDEEEDDLNCDEIREILDEEEDEEKDEEKDEEETEQ